LKPISDGSPRKKHTSRLARTKHKLRDLLALRKGETLLERAGVPGSALVLADGVTPAQAEAAAVAAPSLLVQFLALSAPAAPVDAELERLAAMLGAPVLRISAATARSSGRTTPRPRPSSPIPCGRPWP